MKQVFEKTLSMVLAIAMICAMVVLPVSAEGETATVSLEASAESAKPGDIVSVNVVFTNNSESVLLLAGTQLAIDFDAKVFEPYVERVYDEGLEEWRDVEHWKNKGEYFEENWKFQFGHPEAGQVTVVAGGDIKTYYAAKQSNSQGLNRRVFATLKFKVLADTESCESLICFDSIYNNHVTIYESKEAKDDTKLNSVALINTTVTINGVAPKLGKVTVTDKDNNTVLDTSDSSKTFGTLEVNGTTDYTYQARAWSTSGKEITGNVTWKLKSGSNLYDELNGATISKEGLLTIPRDAGAELSGNFFSFWVVATPKDGVSGNAIETNNIQINHEAQEIKTIQISRKNNETGALIIPGTGEEAATAEFVATCTNQYGRPYTGNQTIYWNYGRQDTNKSVTGIRMNGAVLSVSSDAKSVENGSVVLVVTATAGSGEKKVTSNGVEITVRRDTVQRPARIEVTGAGSIDIPTTGEKKEIYTATVYDQYGDVIADPGMIEWKLYDEYGKEHPLNGVNIANGVVTVTKEAAKNSFNDDGMRNIRVRAYYGEVYGESGAVHLTREPTTVKSIAIEGIGDNLCVVPTTDQVKEDIGQRPLTVKKTDQYGVTTDAKAGDVTWYEPNVTGVTLQHSILTISPAAAANKFTTDKNGKLVYSFDIKAICGGVSATKTITLTRQLSEATKLIRSAGNTVEVPSNAQDKANANVTVTVSDQYGLEMPNAEVQPDGTLPTGFVWENGLKVTKDASAHFVGRRQEEVEVSVNLKSGSATATAKVTLKLENAQTGPQSATISGTASIAKPTGEQTNTAEYSIGAIVDQYGLPITFEPSKLTMKLYSDAACGNEVTNGPVTLSGNTITVTKDATLDKTYYLKASYQVGTYSPMQCAPVKEITIVDKTVSNTLTVTQSDFTYGEEGKLNPVVKKGSETITNATFVYTKGGQIVTEVKDAGKYTVTATCEDATCIYTGSVDFQILPKQIKVGWIDLTNDEYTYNGQQQTVQYTVKDGNTTLVKDRDYTVEGDKQTNAGVHLLKIIGKGNYTSDPTGAPSVNWNIWELPVRINTATFQPRAYAKDNYSAELDTLTLVTEDGSATPDTLTAGDGFTVSDIRVTNNNAGQQPVSFKVTLTNNNYKWAVPETGNIFNVPESAGCKVTINKIDHRAETVSAEGKYGNQLAMDLAQYLEGGSAAVGTITDNENILDAVAGGAKAIMQNGKLWLQLTGDPTKVSKSAQVTLTVNSTNYNPFTITVTITVQNKKTQTVTANDLNVTYGDAGVKLNASALDNAKLTYQVIEGTDVIAVDANGNVTLLKSGTAKIQITAAETEDYGVGTKLVTVTVAKRSLTVKANDLTAYVGGQLPALDYTVTGLVSGETLTTVPELELKDVPAGVEPMKTAGTYTIGFKTAPAADPDKYDLTVETGTLTVSSRPNVNPVPAGNSVKLEEAAGGKLTSSVSRATKGTTVTITVKPDAGYQLEELEVLDKNGESLPLKELANGKFSFQMPDSKVTVQASFVQESTYAGYPDVLPQDWFYSSVRYVTERGLMNGTPNGFEPNMDSSRATIWTILARFSGVDTTVVSGEWYAVARQWAMENGVSDGTNPNGVITREQLATMLYRFAKNKGLVQEPVTADLSVFVDAGQISGYALDAMRWAVSVGLLNGMDGNRLAPQGSAARAQVAAMLMRFDQLAK